MSTVPIVSPSGDIGDVPFEQMQAALHAGGKPGVTIKSPDGKLGVVPADRYQDAVKAGGTVVPYQEQETQHPGFWARAADLMGGMLHPGGFSPYPGMDQEAKSGAATEAAQQDRARKAAGYSLPYRAAAPLAESLGVNVPAMEQSAKEGDVGGVAAGAAVPLATLAAGEALAHGAPAVADAAKTATESRIGRTVGKTAFEAATDFPIIRKLAKLKENYEATAPGAQPELDATAENKPYAGAPKPKAEVLDATGENKPFAGGMDEPAPSKPRTIVRDPQTGQPEFSDVVEAQQRAAKQEAAQSPTDQPKPVAAASPVAQTPKPAVPAEGTLEERLAQVMENQKNEPRVPEPQEDLTALLQQSLDQVKARPGGVMTSADPAVLTKRWGVDPESLASGREQTRGMSPEQTEDYINKLAESYKKGRPVEPVMETRDADNNVIEVDGRARAVAAERAGVERVPIMIRRLKTAPAPAQ